MAETAYFFDGINYSEAAQADFQAHALRPQGVFADSPLGVLGVTATNGNLSVNVTPGEAMVQGFYYRNDAAKNIVVAANSSGSTRIDTIVLRLNRTANTLVAAIVQGTPGAGSPALTQLAGGTWEFALANIVVASGAVSIVAGNLTDVRVYSVWTAASQVTGIIAKGSVSMAGVLTNSYGVASVTVVSTYVRDIVLSVATKSPGGIPSYIVMAVCVATQGSIFITKLTTTSFRVSQVDAFDFIVFD